MSFILLLLKLFMTLYYFYVRNILPIGLCLIFFRVTFEKQVK